VRSAPRTGPTSSDSWNDSAEEIANDLSSLTLEWNNKLAPIILGLPNGVDDTSIDAFANGLDGNNLWVDKDVVSTSDDLSYYDSTNARPVTVKEAFDDVYTSLTTQIAQVLEDVAELASGLTAAEKTAIGDNIFDATIDSSADSLDTKSENSRFNVLQLAKDLYDEGSYNLGYDGYADLTYSVRDMVDALLQIHNGDWNTDIVVDHVGSVTLAQSDVGTTAPGDDTYGGVPADLEDDLDQIRTQIHVLRHASVGSWTDANTALYVAGATSLEELLTSTAGSGTKAAGNPWGYHFDDVEDLTVAMDAVRDFTGQTSHTDDSPSYIGENYISDGDSLETAVDEIDVALAAFSGVMVTAITNTRTFVGQSSMSDSTPTYSSTVYVTNGNSLETSIGNLDSALSDHKQDPLAGDPPSSREHWADTIHVTASGTRLDAGDLEDTLGWMANPDITIGGEHFRRLETSAVGPGPWSVTHNRNSYPIVQLVQINPTVSASGEFPHSWEHTSVNAFTLTLASGYLTDSLIVALW